MIRIIPLGGLGEIGSNMVAWSDGESGFLVDCGILFPYEEVFELDYLIPNFEHLDPDFYKAIFITHSHEDHIGAICHVVQWNPKIVIYGTEFSILMMKKKLAEYKMTAKFVTLDDDAIKIKNWKIHSLDINHSTPQTQCLVIGHLKTSVSFCYASDFKINLKAVDGPAFKPNKVKKLMAPYKMRVAMLDSTNILNTGKTDDEGSLLDEFEKIISKPGRCFITLFASNVRRLNNIVRLSKKHRREIVVMGRSVWNTIHQSSAAGVAEFEAEDFSAIEDIANASSENLVIIISGCQGDFRSSVRRVAYGEDPKVKLNSEDRFIFSSKVIPGNEDKISRIYNRIAATGAKIITAYEKLIHCSGHAGQKDLQLMVEGCDFTHYVPVHGETYFLYKHRDFVQKKYPQIEVELLNNGQELQVVPKAKNLALKVQKYSDWKEPKIILSGLKEIERTQVSQRRKLASTGLVVLSVADSKNQWKCSFLGLPLSLDSKKEQIINTLFELVQKEGKHKKPAELAEMIRIKCRNLVAAEIGQKPVCVVH